MFKKGNKNVLLMDIETDISAQECFKKVEDFNKKEKIFIPFRIFITNGQVSFIMPNKIVKQKIYIIKQDEFDYFIAIGDHEIKILQQKKVDSLIHAVEFDLNTQTNECEIRQVEPGLRKHYPLKKYEIGVEISYDKVCSLLVDLLNNLKQIKSINNILNFNLIYNCLDSNEEFEKETYVKENETIILKKVKAFKKEL